MAAGSAARQSIGRARAAHRTSVSAGMDAACGCAWASLATIELPYVDYRPVGGLI